MGGTAQMLHTVPLGLLLCKAIVEEAFEISAVSTGWGGLVSQYPSILRQAGSIPAFLRQTFEGSFSAASKPICAILNTKIKIQSAFHGQASDRGWFFSELLFQS